MQLQATILLLIACGVRKGESVASDACVDGIRCVASGATYRVYENAECTGQGIGNNAEFTCPAVSPNCYGSRVGVTPATSAVQGTGPCLPAPPPCTAPGNFSINNTAGTRVCRAFYACTGSSGVGTTQVCTTTGEEFNVARGVCEVAASANCSIPACTTRGKVADPGSCRHYYRCGFFGRRSRLRCPFNLHFDTNAGNCRRNAPCGARPLPPL